MHQHVAHSLDVRCTFWLLHYTGFHDVSWDPAIITQAREKLNLFRFYGRSCKSAYTNLRIYIAKMTISDLFLSILCRSRAKGRHLADFILKCVLLPANCCNLMPITLKLISKSPIHAIPVLDRIMVLTENATSHYMKQWLPSLLTLLCVT